MLTGDDGYNSIGTRLLIHFLKDKYELAIAGTKTQQSGVGGSLTLKHSVSWEEIEVDGILGVCVHGSPCDAIEFSQWYFKKSFDLVISGLNLGPNVGPTLISSGTYSAGLRTLGVGLAKRAIVASWNAPTHLIMMDHHMKNKIDPFVEYPGRALNSVIAYTIKKDFWGTGLVNINLPQNPSSKIKMTKLLRDATKFFRYPVNVNLKNKTFSYPFDFSKADISIGLDAGAIKKGYISITPINIFN